MTQRARPWGPGTSAIVRSLFGAATPLTQVELAGIAGVSQPRVSQVLARLSLSGAVQSTENGYVGHRDQLIDSYLAAHRPALATPDQHWYSLQSQRDQVGDVCRFAKSADIDTAVSADLAPDLLAAWRHPTLTVVYVDDALDLTPIGFVPAEGRGDATVIIRHTSDLTLFVTRSTPDAANGLPLVDPLQQIWDLHDLGGHDRREAAERLRRALHEVSGAFFK